jgi:sRNA-binding protein
MITQEVKNNKELEVQAGKERSHKEKGNKTTIMLPDKYEEALSELSAKYPKLFNKKEVKLLKIGIKEDIISAGGLTITKSQLSKFLKVYCTNSEYKKLHIENAKRHGLDGNESGVVTKEHVEGLIKVREEAKKKWELKKQKKIEWAKKQKEKNNKAKEEKNSTSKDQKSSSHSKADNDTKVIKSTVTEDNIGNIKSNNSRKPKLGLKK